MKKLPKKKIVVEFSMNDLAELMNGNEKDWTYLTTDGEMEIDIHLYNEDAP